MSWPISFVKSASQSPFATLIKSSNTLDARLVRARAEQPLPESKRLVPQIGWDFAAILRELDHDLFVQPDVHCSAVFGVAGIVQFFCQFLSRTEATIKFEQLHKIDDRLTPIQFFLVLAGELAQNGFNVDLALRRHRSLRRRRRGCRLGRRS